VSDLYDLERFIRAQDGVYESALAELRAGSKQSHWMWFIFPQLRGLGHSQTAVYYGISSLEEAHAYLSHPLLGTRLRECVEAVLHWRGRRSAQEILGSIDAVKLRSSLTLFDRVDPHSLFDQGLLNFFAGKRDELTLALLHRGQ
jgi:uncharacterized protein (DUF1810 family)